MTTALILREPMLGTRFLQRFVRRLDLRTPRNAVRRCIGTDLAGLRNRARIEGGPEFPEQIAKHMMEHAFSRRLGSRPPSAAVPARAVI